MARGYGAYCYGLSLTGLLVPPAHQQIEGAKEKEEEEERGERGLAL